MWKYRVETWYDGDVIEYYELGEFKKCSRCKQACYCSKECQLQHWKNGHKKECKAVNVD